MAKVNLPDHDYGRFCKPVTDAIIDATGKGVPIKYASEAAGISLSAVYRWRNRGIRALTEEQESGVRASDVDYPYIKFAIELEQARAEFVKSRIETISIAGETGQWQASAWWLERQLPEEFGRTDRHELTGREGGPIQIGQAEIVSQAQQIVAQRMKELEQ